MTSRLDRGRAGAGGHRAAGLICASGLAYLRRPGCLRAPFQARGLLRDTGRNGGPRERGVRRARRRTRGARARARRNPGRNGCGRPDGRRGGHRQDPARLRARQTCPRRRVRGPARPLDQSRRHRAALPAVPRGAAPARGALASRPAGARLAAARVRGDAGAAHRARRCRTRATRARGPALGRYLNARPGHLPRAQPRRPAHSAARHLPGQRALIGPDTREDWRTGSGAPAPRSPSSSARSSATSSRPYSRPTPALRCPRQ